MAGTSRVLGRYHIQSDNFADLELGRNIAKETWGEAKKWRIDYFKKVTLE